MITTIQTAKGNLIVLNLYFSNTFKGRGGWNINLEVNGGKFKIHIYTTSSHFIDGLSRLRAEDESWDTIQNYYGENFLHLFEDDLKIWVDEIEEREVEESDFKN